MLLHSLGTPAPRAQGVVAARLCRGFTLKELLIVVTGIALLVAILIPSLNGARRAAYRANCLSNLRQIGYAFNAYATANRGQTMAYLRSPQGVWEAQLAGYYTDVQKGDLCPVANKTNNSIGSSTLAWGPRAPQGSPWLDGRSSSYTLNAWTYNYTGTGAAVTCRVGDLGGTPTFYSSIVSTENTGGNGNPTVNGNITAGGSISLGGSSLVNGALQPNTPGLMLPDVRQIYYMLLGSPQTQAMAGGNNVNRVDFTNTNILAVSGDISFHSGCQVIGSGTLIVSGNVNNLPRGGNLNIVTLGSVSGSSQGQITGSIYAVGEVRFTGQVQINGYVVTESTFTTRGNGGTVTNGPAPWFDFWTNGRGFMRNVTLVQQPDRIPIMGDGIWVDASPTAYDPVATNLDTGRFDSQLGRFYIRRHGNAVNMVFLDGHAETVALTNLRNLQWQAQ